MKKKLIIVLLLLFCGLIMNYTSEKINVRHLTTDSGFDYDYSSSSSSSDYGSSSSSSYDYDSGSSSSSSGSSGGPTSPFDIFLILLFLIVGVPVSIINTGKESKKREEKKNIYRGVPKTPEIQELLDNAYQIFVDVQKAWMDFDYNKMRELVTDELYNMYYNQLQTLSIKGEKNVMSNFQLINIELLSEKEENNKKYYKVDLTVSFYDYIVDSNDKIVRGNDNSLIIMHYILDYVKSNNEVDRCLKCGAKIENGITTCPYCHSHIQGVSSKMKLSSKRVITQR
jgi:hypothetical protein